MEHYKKYQLHMKYLHFCKILVQKAMYKIEMRIYWCSRLFEANKLLLNFCIHWKPSSELFELGLILLPLLCQCMRRRIFLFLGCLFRWILKEKQEFYLFQSFYNLLEHYYNLCFDLMFQFCILEYIFILFCLYSRCKPFI